MKNLLNIFFVSLVLGSCGLNETKMVRNAAQTIIEDDLAAFVSVLGSDEFMGRKPFSAGEKLTIEYLAKQYQRIGLEPAFEDSYFQDVKLVEILSKIEDPAIISLGKNKIKLNFPDDIAINSKKTVDEIDVKDSELVFAGFGIVAPEYNWDDYEGIDVKGKTVVVLVNDPGLYTGNNEFFKGKTMTYYGRWTYKYEEAERQGAAGILIIHETTGAGYPYTIPRKSALSTNFYIDHPVKPEHELLFNGWISAESSDRLLEKMGMKTDSLRMAATQKDFKSFPMNASISLKLSNSWEFNISKNVVGIIRGNKNPDQCIIYSAHWDHFGIGEKENGDSIYNGAVDNGTSLAWILEIAEAFKSMKEAPGRSIVFLAPTAEEQGLLGSEWYAEYPVFRIENTLAAINNDLLLPIGRMKDVMVTGYGQSDLDLLVEKIAVKQDRYIYPDPNPHTGMYFRSDHFSFVRKGIPSLFIRGNCDSREYGKEWAAAKEQDYIKNKYHRPADNYEPESWDFSGIAEDAQMAFEIGYILTRTAEFPEWSKDSEFAKLR